MTDEETGFLGLNQKKSDTSDGSTKDPMIEFSWMIEQNEESEFVTHRCSAIAGRACD
jgi:hypothetical protein